MAGFSQTPLARKLGIKSGYRVRISHAPQDYLHWLQPLPPDVLISTRIRCDIDIWHFFTRSESALHAELPRMRATIKQAGSIWVSWPKKASRVRTDMSEDAIRDAALKLGLVDVKVCAVDGVWSGLKLVIRRELREA